MTNRTYSQLPQADVLSGPEIIPIMQGGTTKQTTVTDLSGAASGLPHTPAAKDLRISDEMFQKLVIPTSVASSKSVVHPSAIYVPEGFGGHRWWMAITPLPEDTETDFEGYENPEIFCSDDGLEWVVPAGLTNPISPDPDPGGAGHNADTNLVLSPDRKTLHCLWVELVGNTEKIQLKSSVDGVTWSSIVTLRTTTGTVERSLSPALNWDPETNLWVLHTVDIIPATNVLNYSTRADLLGAFGARTACTLTNTPSGLGPWHMDIKRLDTGRWFGVINLNNGPGLDENYAIDSDDFVVWSLGAKLSMFRSYKNSIVPLGNNTGMLYWGTNATSVWWVNAVRVRFDNMSYTDAVLAGQASAGYLASRKMGRYSFEDSFQRVNENPLATSDSGDSWSSLAGAFEVVSNEAVPTANTNSIAVATMASPDADVTVEIPNISGPQHMVLRASNSSNFQRVTLYSDHLTFQRVGGGGTAVLDIFYYVDQTKLRVRALCIGETYRLYVNDKFVGMVVDSSHSANVKFGFQAASQGSRFNRVIVSKVGS